MLAAGTATVTVALFGVATSELWYVSLVCVQAVALALLARTTRGHRPTLERSEVGAETV